MRQVRCSVLLLWLVAVLGGCAGVPQLRGFSAHDALVTLPQPEPVEVCDVRHGRLVLEVENVIVREYPHPGRAETPWRKQPILLVGVSGQPGIYADGDLQPFAAPEEYHAGDRIRAFEGRRLLDRPLRTLRGRRLDLRLAQNRNRSAP